MLEHGGNAHTSAAGMRLVPSAGYCVVVLTNTNSGPLFDAADALLDEGDEILGGASEPTLWPAERLFKAAVFLGAALAVLGIGIAVSAGAGVVGGVLHSFTHAGGIKE